MDKSKKNTRKPAVKVQDLKPKADPKGGILVCAKGEHLKEATITH